jgi:hypothetical protein
MGSGELIQTLMRLFADGGASRLPFAEYIAKHMAGAERSPTLAAAAIATVDAVRGRRTGPSRVGAPVTCRPDDRRRHEAIGCTT